ncbi:hypothetical protein D3C81_679110 [compost metagenome]
MRQFRFLLLQQLDFFFQRALGDQFIHEHGLVLADAPGAVRGLVFRRRIPPRIVVDHRVGRRQVQSHAARFQADQEDRYGTLLEGRHLRAPVFRFARQQRIRDIARFQFFLDQFQHAGKLREDEDLASFVEQVFHHLHQVEQLGRTGRLLLRRQGFHQARVAAHLPQLQQRFEDDDLAARHALLVDFLAHFLIHRQAHGFVQVALRPRQFHLAHHLRLRRQFLGHVIFRAAQQERLDAAVQQHAAQRVVLAFDRMAELGVEGFLVAQQARQQEVELRPQFAQVVFQRRAGQTQAVARAQQARALRRLAARILDVVRFVEDDQVEIMLAQGFLVARQQGVGGQHQVALIDLVELLRAVLALQQQHFQAGRELGRLVLPVAHQTRRRNDERRMRQTARFLFHQDMRQGLHRLAETHVIGQDARQVMVAQELHPRQAIGLVVAQGGLQTGWRRHFLHGTELAQLAAHGAQLLAARPAQFQPARQVFQARRVQGRHAHRMFDLVAEVEFPQRVQDRAHAAPRQGHARAIGQGRQHLVIVGMRLDDFRVEIVGRVADQLHQHGQQRHALVVDDDAQFQFEPGVAAVRVLVVDLRIPVVHVAHVVAVLGRLFHDPALLQQGINAGLGKTQPVRLGRQQQGALQAAQGGGARLLELQLGQGGQRARFIDRVSLDNFRHLAHLPHHPLRRVERDALAIVVVGQYSEVMPALDAAVGQHGAVHQQHRLRRHILAQALRQGLRQRHQMLQALRQQQLRHAHLVVGVQGRRLRHQRLQVGQGNVGAALVQFQHAARQVVDIPRRIGGQHVVYLVGAMVLRAFRRIDLPAQAHGLALVAPEQARRAHGTFFQRVHEAIADIGPGIGPQQLILLGQHFQQGRADLALRLRGAARLRILPAAHGHEETHEVFVGRRQKAGRRRQQRKDFADGRRRRHVAIRPQPRLVQAQGHVAAAAGGRQHVDQTMPVELGIRFGNRQHGLRMGGCLHPLQPGGDGIRQRRTRRAGRGNWGFTGFVAGKIHGAH